METLNSSGEPAEELGEKSETFKPEAPKQVKVINQLFILALIVVITYGSWRIIQDQRVLNQLQQTNRALQEDVSEYKQKLEVTAGQLDLAINAVTLARIHRDEGQKSLREMEDRLAESREAREALEAQAKLDQTQIESLSRTLAQTDAALDEAINLPDYQYKGSYLRAVEFISSTFPIQSQVLTGIVEGMGEFGWKFEGNDPDEGFDSQGLAAFVLTQCGLTTDGIDVTRGQLTSSLDSISEPEVGDLVSFPGGYFMFFFIDQDGIPFVVGMTPYGVQLFMYDFKEIEGVYQVPYQEETRCDLPSKP